jgi:myo-inositol-1(or 4)-monophosphatase
VQAARQAAKTILVGLDRIDSIRITEKRKNDFVTSVDKASEHEIITMLQQAYPSHQFLSEEGFSTTALNDKDDFWIIDPLDGTTNFIYGIPHFAISIAFMSKGKLEYGLIYDPIKDELFTAVRGSGARLNQRRISVSPRKSLEGALIGAGSRVETQALHGRVGSMRRSGSAALDLAYVAAGRYDGFVDANLKTWDVAAGHLLIAEAGGQIKDFSGRSGLFVTDTLIASNKALYTELHPLVQ